MTEMHIETGLLGKEVPVGSIELELKRLWEADEASTKASLMNLAVYSEDPRSLERNSRVTQELTREHACRVILIGMDRRSETVGVRAWITTHCNLVYGKKSVCCEQLSFLLAGKAAGRLRNTVFANLASDLPLVFWWQGELSDLFEPALYRRIDRLLFDSTEWAEPRRGFEMIRQAAEDVQHPIVLHDLAWTRSHHFRLALAGLFDDPVAERALPEVSEVRVVAHPQQRTTALLLAAWLATQADWRPASEIASEVRRRDGSGERFAMTSRDGREVQMRVEWDEDGAPLSRLEVRAPDCVVAVWRERGAPHVQQRIEGHGHLLSLSGPADADDQVTLVADQLSRGGKNALFRKIWPRFFELLGEA